MQIDISSIHYITIGGYAPEQPKNEKRKIGITSFNTRHKTYRHWKQIVP
jgi:hypothetical protein